jgi:hypothetical protein
VAGAFAEGVFVEGAGGAFSAGEGAGVGSAVCDRAVPARPQVMSEAVPEARMRLINTDLGTDICFYPNKAANGFVAIARIRKRLPPACGGLIASSSQGIGHEPVPPGSAQVSVRRWEVRVIERPRAQRADE